MESNLRSKLFKAGNNKNLGHINGLKSRFKKKNDYLDKKRGDNITVILPILALNRSRTVTVP
jgi:hypothetical protein